jgi:hypothetical protein
MLLPSSSDATMSFGHEDSADINEVGSPMETQMALEKEQRTYERERQNLLASAGKYVLIGDDAVVGIYDAYADALKAGYDKFGVKQPFLVKRIEAVEGIQCFTRDLSLACHT